MIPDNILTAVLNSRITNLTQFACGLESEMLHMKINLRYSERNSEEI